MNKEQFVKTHCQNCGSQRCEGIDSEWFDGCKYKWELDGTNPSEEIERLNSKIMDLSKKIISLQKNKDDIIKEFSDKILKCRFLVGWTPENIPVYHITSVAIENILKQEIGEL